MTKTRRTFLKTTAALAAGITPAWSQRQRDRLESIPDSAIQVPKVKFFGADISRLILGVNPFYGFSHNVYNYSIVMREWYTQARVVEVLKRAESFGINAFNYVHMSRGQADWERYLAEGGKMRLIAQATTEDPAEVIEAVKPWAAWVQGEITDAAYREGKLHKARDYAKKMRDLGVAVVGVASHIPEVLMEIEEQGWDVDFYAGCAYNIRRTRDEFRKLLGGELPELPNDIYLQDDPPRMYKFMRQCKKPCIAYKILAAGRVSNVEMAFKRAFDSIKPNDLVCVGMFPRVKDEVKEDAYFASRYGVSAT
ncbi:MAG TPA: hypothetical protein PLA43_15290 [Bryobacteraceae bacterium]|nr:hypothetical protein [Bryobacteraceae bacterium]HOQ46525.1 hypothetical protein [Bryobacteraceae bacterium]HPQ14783.1 hypothetical protein [Bryobacteraceae bacterium]HPU73316.1 hypothetical protein [Bryobacteraceae bacterium]